MRRLVTLLMMIMVTIAPCSLVSAAICRHESGAAHAQARADSDVSVANSAHSEETAASLARNGTLSDLPSPSLLADLLPAAGLDPPAYPAEPICQPIADDFGRADRSVAPLLEPPAA